MHDGQRLHGTFVCTEGSRCCSRAAVRPACARRVPGCNRARGAAAALLVPTAVSRRAALSRTVRRFHGSHAGPSPGYARCSAHASIVTVARALQHGGQQTEAGTARVGSETRRHAQLRVCGLRENLHEELAPEGAHADTHW